MHDRDRDQVFEKVGFAFSLLWCPVTFLKYLSRTLEFSFKGDTIKDIKSEQTIFPWGPGGCAVGAVLTTINKKAELLDMMILRLQTRSVSISFCFVCAIDKPHIKNWNQIKPYQWEFMSKRFLTTSFCPYLRTPCYAPRKLVTINNYFYWFCNFFSSMM